MKGTYMKYAVGVLCVVCVSVLVVACGDDEEAKEKVALMFVGHGEPAACQDGDKPITLADGTPFGPHATTLGVPEAFQYTEWAAAYEEIATAMTYVFPDLNENGTPHEVAIAPAGDVPAFFTWEAFHDSVYEHYNALEDYSPHNDVLKEHINSLNIEVEGAEVDVYTAFLDAVPRIPDVVYELTTNGEYKKLAVVPILLATSTHTQEVANFIHETAHMTAGMDVVVAEPFFEIPYMRTRLKNAVISMAKELRKSIPGTVGDKDIGVVLASHGTPYVPPFEEFGWQEDEIFSNLILTENLFHDEIAEDMPWVMHTGRMNFATPTIEDGLVAMEDMNKSHVMVIPSAFPTPAIHTMWDVANPSVGRAVLPGEGIVTHTRDSGLKVYYTSSGYADMPDGRQQFRTGLTFIAELAVIEVLQTNSAASP